MTRVAIAAGGTAGHVVPALAVADALRDKGAHVEFLGGERAEAELVPSAGYPFHPLRVAGLDRRNPLKAARALLWAGRATGRARRVLRAMEADIVLGGGGYVAAPVGLAARSLGLPLVLTEADSHLGVANRLLAPFAKRVFLAFDLPKRTGGKWIVTGRPIPAGMLAADRAAARARFGIDDDRECLLVFGGSLGARRLNEAAIEAFGSAAPCWVLHACGRRDYPELARRLERLGRPDHYKLHAFITPFSEAYAAADLAVARAGGSVFELLAAGVPAVLVPYPHATADHQTKNARWTERGGAAVVVPDDELDGPRLAREVAALLGSSDRLRTMQRTALALARPDAAERVAHEILMLGCK
jgi:UDP-N-acetylglucosamine--N-acetylmuramyl-(pentapeptide) pyrophosphoryl-undecaprenol N-acetylglucosamine transferase